MSRETLQKAVDLAGGQAPLARGIRALFPESKIGQVHIWGWLNSAKMEVPPAEAVIPISKTVGWQVTPHELRPDIYPNTTDALPPEEPCANPHPPVNCSDCQHEPVCEDRRKGERRRLEKRMQISRRSEDL